MITTEVMISEAVEESSGSGGGHDMGGMGGMGGMM
jgi:chaperonin GroEL